MNQGVLQEIARVESYHWWYRGLRDVWVRSLETLGFSWAAGARVLDAGCGTGASLGLLAERARTSYLGGFDLSPEAVAMARQKVANADIYQSDVCDPEIHSELDLILSFDVIYIPGTERCLNGLRKLVAHLAPGGLLVLNLPAYAWLYSSHDVAVHSHERYTAGSIDRLLAELDLECVLLSYRLCFLFPLVAGYRLLGKLWMRPDDPSTSSDLKWPLTRWLHNGLTAVLRFENRLIARGLRLPWGSSVFAVARKPALA